MKAIQIQRFGTPDVLEYVDRDRPEIKADEVLVKVAAAAINPKDCLVRKGKFKMFTGSKFPMQLGEDIAGTVEEVGASVRNFKSGEEVYGMINGWKVGGYAEYARIKAQELATKPKNLSFEEAAGIPLAALTALQALRDLGKIKSGQKVLINGCSGGVGVFAVQLAKAWECEVVGVCSGKNIEMSKNLGCDRVIDYTQGDILRGESSYDIFFDVFGNQSFAKARKSLKASGVMITTVPNPKNLSLVAGNFFRKQKFKLVVVKSNTQDLEYLRSLIEVDKLKAVIDSIHPLQEVAKAHAYVETKRAKGKVILKT